jgi:copper homeostasis protein (lipoprotein)
MRAIATDSQQILTFAGPKTNTMKSILVAIIVVALTSCQTQKTASSNQANGGMDEPDATHTSENALDWDGIYRGILPCADCEGIQTTIILKKDFTFTTKKLYLGKSDGVHETTGKFRWNKKGNTIIFTPMDKTSTTQYFVSENYLTQLDTQGNKITGEIAGKYILSKSNYEILEKYWKLIELNGRPVIVDSAFVKEPHIIFKENNRLIGNGGCNSISGEHKIEGFNLVAISKMISTKMACPNMNVEQEFLEALQNADNFNVVGDMLTLNKARMAPLARFKAVYMK